MIKTLLDADENPPPNTKVIIEETVVETPSATPMLDGEQPAMPKARAEETGEVLEIPAFAASGDNRRTAATMQVSEPPIDAPNFQNAAAPAEIESFILPADDKTPPPVNAADSTLFQTDFKPESQAETMRKSGLAYAAAITLFGAVVFMMILGWGADLLLGTAPWGIVVGIALGAIIGFVQFFRLTSQIIKDK